MDARTIYSHDPRRMAGKASAAAAQLKRLRDKAGLTVREVAEKLGKKQGSSYAYYEDEFKKQFLPLELVRELIPIFGPAGIERADLLRLAGVQDDIEALPAKLPGEKPAPRQGTVAIDELDATASAGPGFLVEQAKPVRTWTMPPDLVTIATDTPLEGIKIIRIKGDSMVPTYSPIDRVMVDTADTKPSPPGVFVVWDGLGLVVKRVQLVAGSEPLRVKITSDNPKYDAYERVLGEAYIQGRVIGKWMWN